MGHHPDWERDPRATSEHTVESPWFGKGELGNKFFHKPKSKYGVAKIGTHILLFFCNAQLALIFQPCLQLGVAMFLFLLVHVTVLANGEHK